MGFFDNLGNEFGKKTGKKPANKFYVINVLIVLTLMLPCQIVNAQQLKKVEEWWITILGAKTHLKSLYYVDAQQRKQGNEKHWLSNGKLWFSTNWKNDIEHGERISYYESGKIESKLIYDMGIVIEEQRFGKPESYEKNHYNSAGLPYQLIAHSKWQIADRETGERKLVMEKEWSPYYAKLVECLVTKPNGDIVYTNPITGEYGLQKANETVMTLYKDNTMKQPTGKRGDGYELKYEYYDANHDRDTKYNLPKEFDIAGYPIKSIEEIWEDDNEHILKKIRIYRTPNTIVREECKISYQDNMAWCIQYDTIIGNDVKTKYVYDDGIVITFSKESGYTAYDKSGKVLHSTVKATNYTLNVLSSRYNAKTIKYDNTYANDKFIFVMSYKSAGIEGCMQTIVKDIEQKHANVNDALTKSVYEVVKTSELRTMDLECVVYKDDNVHEVWHKKPYMLPDNVYKQLDSLCQLYNMIRKSSDLQYPYQHMWLNDLKQSESQLVEKVLERKNSVTEILSETSLWFVFIDMNTMTGKICLDLVNNNFDIMFDKNGLSEHVQKFIRNCNSDYPMSDDERKAFLKDLKKRQKSSNSNTSRTGGSGVVGGLLRHL